MSLRTIQITATISDGYPEVPDDVKALVDALQAAEPSKIYVTDDQIADLANLHFLFHSKLAEVPHEPFKVFMKRPKSILHIPDRESGKWVEVKDSVAIIYEIADQDNTSRIFCLGIHAEAGSDS